jgi:hypothetical protein
LERSVLDAGLEGRGPRGEIATDRARHFQRSSWLPAAILLCYEVRPKIAAGSRGGQAIGHSFAASQWNQPAAVERFV